MTMGYIYILLWFFFSYIIIIIVTIFIMIIVVIIITIIIIVISFIAIIIIVNVYIYSQIESIDGNPNLLGKYLLCDLDCLWTHPQQLDQLGPSQLGSQQVTRMKLLINLGAFSHFSPLHTFTSHRLWWCGDSLSFQIIGENWLKWWFRAHET